MDPRFKFRRHRASKQEERREEKSEENRLQLTRGMSYALVMPTYLAFGPVCGYLIGNWLDQRYATAFWVPTLVVLFVIAGFTMAIRLFASLNK